MAVLIGMSPEVKGKNYDLAKDKVSIGRNATNLIVLEHPSVSGRHCSITHVNNRYVFADLGSTNGSRVNQKEVKEAELKPKDLVQIGALEFMFDREDAGGVELQASLMKADIEETQGPATAPVSFGSISPFGARNRSNNALWVALIVVVGILAVGAVGALLLLLLK